ncbi:hypothetical protein C8J57DRAFT_1475827 [Mycena rebaudengoi]|nr:hypothetical protein C8J57DRAFT_1475827 [Mycena rebaudengoi]
MQAEPDRSAHGPLACGTPVHSIVAVALVFKEAPSPLQVGHVLDLPWSEVREYLLAVAEFLEPPGLPEHYYSNFLSRHPETFVDLRKWHAFVALWCLTRSHLNYDARNIFYAGPVLPQRPSDNPRARSYSYQQPPSIILQGVVDGDVDPSLMRDGGVAMSPCISSYDALGSMGGRTHDPLQLHGSHRPPSMDIQQRKRMPPAPTLLLVHHLQPGSNNNNAMTDQAAAAALGLRGGLGNGGGKGNVWPADDGDGEDRAPARRTMAGAGSKPQQQQYQAQLQGPGGNGMGFVSATHLEPYPAPAFDPVVTELLAHGNHLHSILAVTLIFRTAPSLLQVGHVLDLSWSEVRDHLLPVAGLLEPPGLPEQYYSNFRISRQLQDFLLDPSRPETFVDIPRWHAFVAKWCFEGSHLNCDKRALLGPPRLQFKTLSRHLGFSPTLPYSASSDLAARTTRGYRMAENVDDTRELIAIYEHLCYRTTTAVASRSRANGSAQMYPALRQYWRWLASFIFSLY